ncbi:ABC transporter substrate-binding protein [Gemmatimonadota bacterium]
MAKPPRRIVSLVPSATQVIQALGAGRYLVGRTDFDTGPELAHLPSVGGGLQPSVETLVALKPDLVVHFTGDSDRSTPNRLAELGIPHFAVRPDRMEDVRQIILDLGELTGFTAEAGELLRDMDTTLGEIQRRIRGERRPRVAYLLGGSPPWVAGGGTFLEELIEAAGGVNVFGDLDVLYGPVSPEELMAREIDLLFLPEGSEVALPGLELPIRRVSPSVELPGPHMAQAAWELAAILHPDLFR